MDVQLTLQTGLRGPDLATYRAGRTRRALCGTGFSQRGPRSSSIGITWELVRDQILTPIESEPLG